MEAARRSAPQPAKSSPESPAGAAIGAIAGASAGCAQAKDCFGRARDHGDRQYDSFAGRYYYVDPGAGDTYWENGEFRSYGRGRGQ